MTTQPPYDPRATEAPDADTEDEVALLLSDARARAQAIIDESVERAQELLRRQPSSQQLERIRRTVADVAVDVRAIHSRLDEIEALIRGGAPMYRSPAAASPPLQPAPQPAQPAYPYSYSPPPVAAPPPAPEPQRQYVPRPVEPAPAYRAPDPAPPPSAIPPQRPPAPPQPAWSPPPATWPQQPPPAEPMAQPQPASATGFDPEGGSVALRISPVAGFQGLMRIQDALARCRGVREAGVEAYAQGEARLRLHLAERLDGEGLARALAEALGRSVRLAAESVPERTIQLALG